MGSSRSDRPIIGLEFRRYRDVRSLYLESGAKWALSSSVVAILGQARLAPTR